MIAVDNPYAREIFIVGLLLMFLMRPARRGASLDG
jgi:hypothetical protein